MNTQQRIQQLIAEHPVVLFMKGTPQFPMCGFSGLAVQLLKVCGVRKMHAVDVLKDEAIREGMKAFANWPTSPQLYVDAALGTLRDLRDAHALHIMPHDLHFACAQKLTVRPVASGVKHRADQCL